MSQSLSETEIKNRLQELRNLRQLHTTARERVIKLEAENKELKTEIKELKAILDNKDKRFDDLSLQLQELKVKVFGQKRPTGYRSL